jgi:SAM-dependent methyltransferase
MTEDVLQPLKRPERWEKFAEADACGYIMTDLAGGGPDAFWQSGEKTVREELLPVLGEFGVPLDCGVELGCGVGRLLLPLSRVFQRMVGVDIAEGMVRRGQAFARQQQITNARFVAIAAPGGLPGALGEETPRVTFVYSLLVFQHISDFQIIESYLAAIGKILSPDGIAYLQFDTRARTLPYHVKTMLPDFLLPKFFRRGIRRIRRSPAELEGAFARSGLRILQERTPRSAEHRYVVRAA